MNLEQINARLAEIRSLLDSNATDIDIDALTTEAQGLIAQRNNLIARENRRQELRNLVADGAGDVIRGAIATPTPGQSGQENRGADSLEYRNAWLKNLARDNQGNMLLGPMNAEERAAFTFTTENTGAVVPVMILERISELVRATAPMLADSTMTNFSRGFGVPRHKSVAAGDAATTEEGVANDDEQDVFDLLALDGEEIKKHIEMSRKMQIQSVDAFYNWVTTHLAERIRAAKERLIIARLDSADVGMAAGNKISNADLTDDIILQAMGKILSGGAKSIYANNATIWNKIAKLKDENGVIDFIRGVFTGDWKRAWSGVVSIFSGIFSGLKNIAKTPLNAIISLINRAIDGINSMITKINKVPGVNIGTIGKLPMLADGGTVYSGDVIVGEAGPELLTVSGGKAVVRPLTNSSTTNNTTHMGGMTFNIYAHQGQSPREIAHEVMEIIQEETGAKEAAICV